MCEERPLALQPTAADDVADAPLVDPSELVDPRLSVHSDFYLRLRASSYQQRSVEVYLNPTPESSLKNLTSAQRLAAVAENVLTIQVDVTTTARALMEHLSDVVMPSLSSDVRILFFFLRTKKKKTESKSFPSLRNRSTKKKIFGMKMPVFSRF